MKRYFPSKTPLVLASAIALSCAIGAWFLWDIAPSGSGTAIGMGLFAMFVILIAPNQRYITAFRLRIPQRYGNDVFHAQSSSDYGSFPRTAVFYRIMTNRSIQEALQLGDPFWYDKPRDAFVRAASFIEDRFSKARYTELVAS